MKSNLSAEAGPPTTSHSSGSETYISLVGVLPQKQELGDMSDARLVSARTEDQDFSSS